jgi:arylsulfatase A-like enzyme
MFWKFLKFVFLIFSLFLLGDAFYRWDGFRYYLPFSDFLPSLALAYVLWSILSILIAILLWIFLNLFKIIFDRIGMKIGIPNMLIFTGIFTIISLTSWVIKKFVVANLPTTAQFKISILITVLITSILLTWLFRNRAEKWIREIDGRTTPLVWIFGLLFLSSFFLITYYIGFKEENNKRHAAIINNPEITKPATDKPNIILVTFDALTARHMSVYGYHRPTTPFIEKWAENASIFTRAIAASSYTGATTASLMTGKRPWTHRRLSHEKNDKPINAETENIAFLLKEQGYYNFAFTPNDVAHVEYMGISNSFDIFPSFKNFRRVATIEGFIEKHLYEFFGDKFKIYNWFGQDDFILNVYLRKIPQRVYFTEYPPEMVFDSFLDTIDNFPGRPFFAWIHLLPPHIPFLPPEPFKGRFSSSNEERDANSQQLLRTVELRKYLDKNLYPSDEFIRKITILKDYYDEFILYCDSQFHNFINQLQRRNLLKNTVIILSADHGEGFKPVYPFHALEYLYEEITHIPLIIKEPRQHGKKVIDNIVEQIDIPATILDFAGIKTPEWMEGQSLVPLIRGSKFESKPAFSMVLLRNPSRGKITKGVFAIWEDNYKLIYYPETEKTVLYNLNNDPEEQNNIIGEYPDVGRRLLQLIKKNIKKANEEIVMLNE